MTVTRGVACLIVLGFLGAAGASAQSLADKARQEKERREKAGAPTSTAPTFSDEDLKKEGGSSEPKKDSASPAPSRAGSTKSQGDHDEAWWRAQATERRKAIASAEAEVKRYEQLVAEARTGLRQPQPSDATNQLPPSQVATDADKRAAEAGLSASRLQLAEARKAMDDLEDEARRKQVPPGWLR